MAVKTLEMEKRDGRPMELLAPAGSIEAFEAAVSAGADAVYIGAPTLNARALAKHFVMAEIAAMVDHAHRHDVKVYVAMNSLMKEEEIPTATHALAAFEQLGVDALILQDLGLYHLARRHFPKLRLHASTLLAGHNSAAVRQFVTMGFQRVVLARELTLPEIAAIHRQNQVELEVFIHGALCFSYSGLCLFSSFQGGKSGLRGRCVQPCRRRYTWSGKGKSGAQSGYLFSMNDLCGIDLIPQLREAGVTSLKIEGRMRSARYVEAVTSAYRMALDAPRDGAEILAAANERLREAMGRRAIAGYFAASQPAGIISPQHSGNIGLFLGKIDSSRERSVRLTLKEPLRCGDRLRLHQEKSGERVAFTLKAMQREGGEVDAAAAGATVTIELPEKSSPGDSLYKVDCCERRADEAKKGMVKPERFRQQAAAPSIRQKAEQVLAVLRAEGIRSLAGAGETASASAGAGKGGRALRWWLKVADFDLLRRTMPSPPERIVVTLTQQTLSQFKRGRRWLEPILDRLVWALPPIIAEESLPFYRRAIGELAQGGFGEWQIGHIGQLSLFQGDAGSGGKGKKGKRPPRRRRFALSGDYTLNILNSLALRCAGELGLGRAQCAIEGDRDNLRAMLAGGKGIEAGMTIYGAVPLFIARLKAGHFQYERPFLSPKGERFVLKEAWGQTVAVADPVFSLLGRQGELAAMGVRYGVVDLSLLRMLKGELEQVATLAAGKGGKPPRQRSSTFNYLGVLD